ncbi:SMI1/KNR4 family protein [Myxococcus sp. RHSTA-1-4]|uniref:SMI1/KNR4 family protein n=1 Tax=Myxococcus sp. RHSTA-1-4 TaxID=2874601 RepID=UPI001CBE4191|nr:SMI1/KNR4 family protein [Myxococcus sp. RHSTA-1-4]MBZ4419825.1 SMI1/KNR4 family protein [Myxococcus sp. RHSTA-1-4]
MKSKIERVMDFMEENWPAHRAPLKGASAEDIAELAAEWRRPLPEDYVAFLQRMGHRTEGLKWEHIDFRVDTMLRTLRYPWENYVLPKRYLLIGEDLTESEYSYALDLESRSMDGTAVVRAVYRLNYEIGPEHTLPEATSLAELLFNNTFLDVRIESLPHRSGHRGLRFVGRPEEKQPFESVLEELGLVRHPLSGPFFQAYECDEGRVAVRWNEGQYGQIISASESTAWLSMVGKTLRSRLPVRL